MKKTHIATIALFAVAIIWGIAFIAVDYALASGWNTFTILALRGLLSGLLLLPFAIKEKIWKNPKLLLNCVIAGVFFFLGYGAQTFGQKASSVVNSAFFTCLYVIFTPFLALLFGKKEVTIKTIIAAVVAIVGIYFLSVLGDGNKFQFHIGDILLVLCAIFFALQIIWAGHFIDKKHSPLATSCVMLLTMGLLSIIAIPISNEALPTSITGITGVIFAALFSSGLCSVLQLFGQKHLSSSKSSILLSLETPFACIFAVIILKEQLNIYSIIGLVLMFISVLLIELKWKKKVNLSKYEYLLFDVDDTLLDFQKAEFMAFNMLLESINIKYTDELYKIYHDENRRLWKEYELGNIKRNEIFEKRLIPLFAHLKIDADPVKYSYQFLDYLSKGAFLLGNSYKVLEELSKTHKLYIITNGEPKVQYPRLESVDILKFFSGVFVSEEIGHSKPNKDFFRYVSEHIEGFDVKKALVIGDSLTSDIIGAINYGIDTCWFNPHNKETDLKIVYEIKSIDELR